MTTLPQKLTRTVPEQRKVERGRTTSRGRVAGSVDAGPCPRNEDEQDVAVPWCASAFSPASDV